MNKDYVAPWVRTLILLVSVVVISILSYAFTGSIIPENPIDALIFQNALLLIVVGVALLERHFTKPADSMVNSLMGIITMLGVYNLTPSIIWWVVFIFVLIIFLLATTTTTIFSYDIQDPKLQKVANLAYQPAVLFGQARVLYSIMFLFAVFTYKGIQSPQSVALVIFWGLFIVIWPLKLPQLLSRITSPRQKEQPIGQLVRTDWPNIIRINIHPGIDWNNNSLKVFQQAGGKQNLILPLFHEPQGDQMVGTGLVLKEVPKAIPYLDNGYIYEFANGTTQFSEAEIAEALGGGSQSSLVGFIVEDSTISEIKFEIWNTDKCWEGMLVWTDIAGKRVYYQVTNGSTKEEIFQANRHGFQLASATQLGELSVEHGFLKYAWVPRMNSPLFSEGGAFGDGLMAKQEGDFTYGYLPGTKLSINGPFTKNMDHHTAILGVTGSGKTELAFDLIRDSINQGIKVVCIDLTAKYEGRLHDLQPRNLSLSAENIRELNQKLFDVETGMYGAPNEKKALEGFSATIRQDIQKTITNFMTQTDEQNRLGIITLEEISNTKATLYITEMFLTCLLHFKKDNTKTTPKVLIVVEEAHTVMPEPSTMGLGDFDSRGLVGKISQIALQGRKYGVGLLVIAQRTATVSKSILTQCNTIISFNCFDDTSLGFLDNIFGTAYVPLIPNLPRLNAIIYGKGVRSQRPIIIQIPFDEHKAEIGS